MPSYCTANSPRRQKYTANHVAARRATCTFSGVAGKLYPRPWYTRSK